MTTDSRLLTAEQQEAIACQHFFWKYNGRCGNCNQVWPCDTERFHQHAAAQAEQIDRQAVLMAWAESNDEGGYSREECQALDAFLGVNRGDEYPSAVLVALNREIRAIRRHGVEVAQRRQA